MLVVVCWNGFVSLSVLDAPKKCPLRPRVFSGVVLCASLGILLPQSDSVRVARVVVGGQEV